MSRGLWPLARNYRCRAGEIDWVMLHRATLVFVEVRLRNHPNYPDGLASVNRAKQHRIIRTAHHFLQRHRQHQHRGIRFDVVSVSQRQWRFNHTWVKRAFGQPDGA